MSSTAIEVAIVAAVGLVVGSFLNVVIQRLPRRQSIVSPASRCPQCGEALRWYENIPVLSFVALRGRCRNCRNRIPVRYPVVELSTAILFVVHYFALGWTPLLAIRLLFAAALVSLFWIDLEHHLLPDKITLPGVATGLAASLFLPPGVVSAALGVLVGGGFLWLVGEAYFRYSGEEGLGGGDIKMLAMIGAFLGWKMTMVTLVLSSITGSVIGLVVLVLRLGGLKSPLPFGTFLAVSALAASIWGEQILAWYLR